MNDEKNTTVRMNARTQFANRRVVKDWLMEPDNNFCIMPYVHMAVESDGSIRPCCMGSQLTDENGERINIAGSTISEIFQHPARQKMVEAFDRNEQFSNCSECWKDRSEHSARVKFSTNIQGALDYTWEKMKGGNPEQKLTWLEIKPGNRCNLKCRICGVHNSSSWTKDSYQLDVQLKKVDYEFKKSPEYLYNEKCKWIDEVDVWCDTENLEKLELIHIMGGEPFMVPEHFEFYKRIIADEKIDHTKISVWYNTNGTYFPSPEQLDILSQFRNVRFSLSIDDIGKRFEYQRNLASWDDVKSNLIKFKQLEQQYPQNPRKWIAEIDATVSIYNILYLEEFVDTMMSLGYDDFREGTHYTAGGHSNLRSLNAGIKQRIQDYHANTKYKWVNDAVRYMNFKDDCDPDTVLRRKKEIATLDKLRNESFAETFPEMWELIKDE
jgi:MoaA/NifB/PqqE/SkfB family radical SAM enzyme